MPAINAIAAPPDPVFALSARYKADTNPKRVDLGIGAYRDDHGQPWVLPVVRKVDQLLANDPKTNHEYLPLTGNRQFLDAAAKLLFGNNADTSKIATVQTLSGTGALHMGGQLLSRFSPFGLSSKSIWVPSPTWGNHQQIFKWLGFDVKSYPYWDGARRQLNFDALVKKLETETQRGDTLLLHACAHNPTGMDPNQEQWKKIAEIAKKRELFVLFDIAYQGFASGDLDRDAWSVRYFIDQKIDVMVCQSFSKNMGLYGERCGAVHVYLTDANAESKANLESQLATQTRAAISTAPSYGSRIAAHILTNPELFAQWKKEVQLMSGRIIEMRHALRAKLESLKTPGTWSHITEQIGMFSFTGLTESQARRLGDEFHIYLLPNGRVSMAGVNTSNVDYIAESFHRVIVDEQGRL